MVVMEVASLKEGEWSCYSLMESMVMLLRWAVQWRENGHVTVVVSLKEGEWSCYRGGQFNGGRMVTLRRWSV